MINTVITTFCSIWQKRNESDFNKKKRQVKVVLKLIKARDAHRVAVRTESKDTKVLNTFCESKIFLEGKQRKHYNVNWNPP